MYNQYIQFLEGSWNHEYFGSLAKLTWSPVGFTNFVRDPRYSWFHEPSKFRTHFLNESDLAYFVDTQKTSHLDTSFEYPQHMVWLRNLYFFTYS